jgi:pimeloyl-ACP methyl ester carboxylesterase
VSARFAAGLAAMRPEGYAGCCEAIAAMDLRPRLAAITAPTLVIAADQDPATPAGHAAVIAAGIPGARLTVIRGASHLAAASDAAQVAARLAAHLRGLA